MQILVLVSLVGLGTAVTASVGVATTSNQAAAALEWTIRSDALAASAFQRISSAITDPADDLELTLLNDESSIELGGSTIGIAIESESSKINLMLADAAVLRRYAMNAGLSPTEAGALFAGMERDRKLGDRRQAFQTLLTALAGKRLHAELAADVTIFGEAAGIDPAYATLRTLSAIPDLSAAQLELLERTPAGQRAEAVHSQYFAVGGSKYSMVATIRQGRDQTQRRLVVQMTAAGQVLPVSPGL